MNSEPEIESLIVAYIPRLRRYAMALVQGRGQIADDLVQDSLERALSRTHLWQKDTDLRAWLFTIMHNVYVNQIRQIKNGPRFVELVDDDVENIPDHTQSPMDLRGLQAALAQLQPDHREVLLLVTLEGLQYQQVADILGVPQGTVMSKLSRARQQLRKLLHEDHTPHLWRVK